MSKRLRISFAITAAAALIALSACSGDKAATAPAESGAPGATGATATASAEPTPMPYTAPLTGLGKELAPTSRPLAVMINNYSAARPQSGLTDADVVWEVLAEGGITRLVAIFQSSDQLSHTIGPIRSNRAYLIDIADSYGAVMAHAGGSPEAYSILKKQGKPYLDEITNAGSYFWRSKERKAPHNLYSSQEKLRAGADKRGYEKEVNVPKYTFSADGTLSESLEAITEKAADITIKFLMDNYKVNYVFDESTGLYKRSINGEPHIDLNNGEQLNAANLIVFETAHRTLDNEGRMSVDLESGGKGYLFQKGKKIDLDWVRSPDGMIRFAKDGTELPLLPGKTYIHIVPNKPSLSGHVTWVSN
ncbi:DUF3048 domain-containing protein [Paenibacillus sp. GCM10027627]|uniref:DUF3048 domain-containing protein n=1 Tax=unclassified Paenibacillus TaxID=185978 RepID=UPI00363E5DC9